MDRPASFRSCLAAAAVLALAEPAAADDVVTDANIVTGLDISESVGRATMRLELEGIAAAIRSPEVLAAIRRGRAGRIGFAVFAWHHGQVEVVPWTLISDARDAERVAAALEARLAVDADLEARRTSVWYIGRLTDLSRAIDHAARLFEGAPATERRVVNIIGNGPDNMGEEAAGARDRLIAAGATLNGVVIGHDPGTLAYFRDQVVGGSGAFLIAGDDPDALRGLLLRKFLWDLMVLAPPAQPAPAG